MSWMGPGWQVALKGRRAPGLLGHPVEAAPVASLWGHGTLSGVLGVALLAASPPCGMCRCMVFGGVLGGL